jgi:hypothetical protein
MPSGAGCVYCYQFGDEDCYKIGKTKLHPEERKRGFATGSPVDITLYRRVETDDPSVLETYIHHLLGARRSKGEFFRVSRQDLDKAVDEAAALVHELQPLLQKANELRRTKPAETILDRSDELRQVALELRAAQDQRWLLERRIELLVSRIQIAIGENCGMEGVASWKWKDHWEMDTKRFEADHKELYEEYLRNSGARDLRLKVRPVENPELAYAAAPAGE